ncbi:STAS domain-containing protein [Virgisporangium aurantiacum]|uniref:STAS domain-containing protein n=1 Tax=Virgisporangium aurantiacum TaxID=175570 RepID=UPI00194F5B9D|nr:STAS domain-containing protein [Virgisporangium aurantiacum]
MALSSQPLISIVARPSTPYAWIRLVGDIDSAAKPALAKAIERLNLLPLRYVVIDLTAVGFVCSTFANFLDALHRAHPHAELVLHHPPPMADLIIAATDLHKIVTTSGQQVSPVTSPAVVPRTTGIVVSNTQLPEAGGSAVRGQPIHWEAMNLQPSRTHDFGNTGRTAPPGMGRCR